MVEAMPLGMLSSLLDLFDFVIFVEVLGPRLLATPCSYRLETGKKLLYRLPPIVPSWRRFELRRAKKDRASIDFIHLARSGGRSRNARGFEQHWTSSVESGDKLKKRKGKRIFQTRADESACFNRLDRTGGNNGPHAAIHGSGEHQESAEEEVYES